MQTVNGSEQRSARVRRKQICDSHRLGLTTIHSCAKAFGNWNFRRLRLNGVAYPPSKQGKKLFIANKVEDSAPWRTAQNAARSNFIEVVDIWVT